MNITSSIRWQTPIIIYFRLTFKHVHWLDLMRRNKPIISSLFAENTLKSRQIKTRKNCIYSPVWNRQNCRKCIISAPLAINIIECKRYWNRPVAYPMCRSVCLSVCPKNVLWQNGWFDTDAVWSGEWDRSRVGCIRWGWWSSKRRWQFWGLIWGAGRIP